MLAGMYVWQSIFKMRRTARDRVFELAGLYSRTGLKAHIGIQNYSITPPTTRTTTGWWSSMEWRWLTTTDDHDGHDEPSTTSWMEWSRSTTTDDHGEGV